MVERFSGYFKEREHSGPYPKQGKSFLALKTAEIDIISLTS